MSDYDIDAVTPRPWVSIGLYVYGGVNDFIAVTSSRESRKYDGTTAKADAAHIVHCVNHHDDLVAFVEAIAGAVWDDPEDQQMADRARALLEKVKS